MEEEEIKVKDNNSNYKLMNQKTNQIDNYFKSNSNNGSLVHLSKKN